MSRFSRRGVLLAGLATGLGARAQQGKPVFGPHLETITIESAALKGNLIGDPFKRELTVLLPPSYFSAPKRRYPVVYLLHASGARKRGNTLHLWSLESLLKDMRAGKLAETIFAAVDGTTVFGGSYYADSPTIGNFATYTAKEVVTRVDGQYRTVAARAFRGLMGFSMGGHGALKLAMRYPDVYSRVGSLSGSPMSLRYRKNGYKAEIRGHTQPTSLAALVRDFPFEGSRGQVARAYAKAAAFSPNPRKPPLYLDLPFTGEWADDEDPYWQAWLDEDPLSLVAFHKKALASLDLLYFDHGDNETDLGTEDFDRELVRYGVSHTHHIFRGDHSDKLPARFARLHRTLSNGWEDP